MSGELGAVRLTDAERAAVVDGFYDSPIGRYGWQGREECVIFAEAVVPTVERIVADRIATLTQDRDQLQADHDLWRQHALAGDAVVEAVRALHPKIEDPRHGCCAHPKVCTGHAPECGGKDHGINRPTWPCATVALLPPTAAEPAPK